MTDQPDNLVVVYLRRIDEKVDKLAGDMREVKERLGILENQNAGLYAQYASLSARIDRLDARIDRIEKRLDLVDAEGA